MAARSAHALACAAILLSSGAALAQTGNNRITILQAGEGNRLTVDQAGATGSRVGGLTVTLGASPATGQLVLSSGPQFAPPTQEGGQPVAIQGSAGELVPVFDRSSSAPALQAGDGNVAGVVMRGTGGFVGLSQQGSTALLPNNALVSLDGNGTALVSQNGQGNRADLRVSGDDAYGAILQAGSGNNVGLVVAGNGARGTISQVGSNNDSSLAVTGATGSSVTYVLQGNGIQLFNPAEGASVVTNAASVTITQTAFGGQ